MWACKLREKSRVIRRVGGKAGTRAKVSCLLVPCLSFLRRQWVMKLMTCWHPSWRWLHLWSKWAVHWACLGRQRQVVFQFVAEIAFVLVGYSYLTCWIFWIIHSLCLKGTCTVLFLEPHQSASGTPVPEVPGCSKLLEAVLPGTWQVHPWLRSICPDSRSSQNLYSYLWPLLHVSSAQQPGRCSEMDHPPSTGSLASFQELWCCCLVG